MVTCPSCGHENPEKFRFCGECHTKLPRVYNPDAVDIGEDAAAYAVDMAEDTPSTETLSDLSNPSPDSSVLNGSLATYKYALESSRANALPGSLLWRTMIGITAVIIFILLTLYALNAPGRHTASVKTSPALTESGKPSAVAGEDKLPDAESEPDVKNDEAGLPAPHNADISSPAPVREGGHRPSVEKPASIPRPTQSGSATISHPSAPQAVTRKPERPSSVESVRTPDKSMPQRATNKKVPAVAPATKHSQPSPAARRPVGMSPPPAPPASDNERKIIEMEKPLASKTPIVIPHGD